MRIGSKKTAIKHERQTYRHNFAFLTLSQQIPEPFPHTNGTHTVRKINFTVKFTVHTVDSLHCKIYR